MYCPSCGKDNPSGATFCNSCGSKLPTLTTGVNCPFCGATGQEFRIYCTKCGKELPAPNKDGAPSGTSTGSLSTKPCPGCGRPMSIYSNECAYCARPEFTSDYSDVNLEGERIGGESELPVIGGVLILIGGILGMVHGGLTIAAVGQVSSLGYSVSGYATCCALLMGLFGLIALFGGYNAIKRASSGLAIVGGIFGILSIGLFLGAFLSLIGLILVAVGRDDFET